MINWLFFWSDGTQGDRSWVHSTNTNHRQKKTEKKQSHGHLKATLHLSLEPTKESGG